MFPSSIYEIPRVVTDVNECYFYHTMDIPGYGLVEGEWDLREGIQKYLGGVDFTGKRVLELGTASGFLCFYMERMGAEVVAYDLSEKQSWDIVPFPNLDYKQCVSVRKAHIRKLNNGYWFNHRAFKSNAKVVYGSIYAIPEQIGMVDISTFSCILLHVRDPFGALQNALQLTKETVIITEALPKLSTPLIQFIKNLNLPIEFFSRFAKPSMRFLPDYRKCNPIDTWWRLSPKIIVRFIGALGFEDVKIKYHKQKFRGHTRMLYTIVGHRTKKPQKF